MKVYAFGDGKGKWFKQYLQGGLAVIAEDIVDARLFTEFPGDKDLQTLGKKYNLYSVTVSDPELERPASDAYKPVKLARLASKE